MRKIYGRLHVIIDYFLFRDGKSQIVCFFEIVYYFEKKHKKDRFLSKKRSF